MYLFSRARLTCLFLSEGLYDSGCSCNRLITYIACCTNPRTSFSDQAFKR